MEDKSLDGWEFLGSVVAADNGDSDVTNVCRLYGKELFGKVRFRLVTLNFDYNVLKSDKTGFSHRAENWYFNFEE